jgi:hypothetical protein
MDDQQRQTLQDANEAHDRGDLFTNPSKLQPYLLDLTNALVQREAAIGKYNHLTAQSYQALGDLYLQIEEPRAVVMHRAAHRINMILYGGHCVGSIRGIFRLALHRKGVAESKFSAIERDLECSMRHEVEGDLLRRFGLKGPAVIEYQKAASLEEAAFGRENPDLAYLWRKIACMAAIRRSTTSGIDIDQMDRISSKWFRQQQKESRSMLDPKISTAVRRGDEFYRSLLYSLAVGEYQKATMVNVSHHHRRDRRSRSRSTSREDGTGGNMAGNKGGESARIKHRSHHRHHGQRSNDGAISELIAFLQTTPRHEPIQNEDSERRKWISSSSAAPGETHSLRGTSHDASQGDNETTAAHSSRSPRVDALGNNSPNAESLRSRITSHNSNMDKVDTVFLERNAEQKSHLPPTTGSSDKASVKPIISRSKMLKPQRSFSGTSMYQAIRQRVDPKDHQIKPKSDSYLAKIAAKTSKMAKKTKKKIKQTMLSSSSHHRSTTNHVGKPPSNSSLHSLPSPNEMRPKSESYALLGSPPMTPLVHSISEAKSRIQRMDLDFSSAFPVSPPPRYLDGNPSTEFDTPSISNSESTTAATNTSSRLLRHLSAHRQNDPDDDDAHDGNNSTFTSDKSIKETFIADAAKMIQSLSMTTGGEAAERAVTNERQRLEKNEHTNQCSLIELVAHVQKMSAVLQRQTFRLQHRLGDSPGGSDEGHRHQVHSIPAVGVAAANAPRKMMLKGQKQMYQEVQQSFDECYSILQRAFDRLDEDDLTSTQHGHEKSWALEEFRKTFTLEKAFVDQLRAGFESHLSVSSKSPWNHTSTTGETRIISHPVELSSSSATPRPKSAGDEEDDSAQSWEDDENDDEESSFAEASVVEHHQDSTLSIVFEDDA